MNFKNLGHRASSSIEDKKFNIIKDNILQLLPKAKEPRSERDNPEEPLERQKMRNIRSLGELGRLFNDLHTPQDLKRFYAYTRKQWLQDPIYKANNKAYMKDKIAMQHKDKLLNDSLQNHFSEDEINILKSIKSKSELEEHFSTEQIEILQFLKIRKQLTKHLSEEDINAFKNITTRKEFEQIVNQELKQKDFYKQIRKGLLHAMEDEKYIELKNKSISATESSTKSNEIDQIETEEETSMTKEETKELEIKEKSQETYDWLKQVFTSKNIKDGPKGKRVELFTFNDEDVSIHYKKPDKDIAKPKNWVIKEAKGHLRFHDYIKAVVDPGYNQASSNLASQAPRISTSRYIMSKQKIKKTPSVGITHIVSLVEELCEKFDVTFTRVK